MKTTVKNFTDEDVLTVHFDLHRPDRGGGMSDPLIAITQSAGSLYFQHTMRLDQARDLAQILLQAVDAAERATSKISEVPA